MPEVVADASVGRVVDRDPESFAAGLAECLAADWDREAIVRYAQSRSWSSTARQCIDVLSSCV